MRHLALLFACLAVASPAAAAAPSAPAAPTAIVVSPATPEATAPAAVAAASLPTVSSAVTISLGTTGDFDRKSVAYSCDGVDEPLTVEFINAPPNYLALVPIDGTVLVFNTVLSASGAKYAAGKYVLLTKGSDASLYDLTEGPSAKPVLSCTSVDQTP
jgi:membrane-bound inhibitor of C-type lysozyme